MDSCYFYHYKIYSSTGAEIAYLTQWDLNRTMVLDNTKLGLSEAPIFHFCNKASKEALVVTSTLEDDVITVKIPNALLREPYEVIAYVYVYTDEDEDSAKTTAIVRIPLTARVKPSEYEYVENVDKITADQIEQSVADKITELEETYEEVLEGLNTSFEEAIATLIAAMQDGSPKAVFETADDLEGAEAGIYVCSTDGYIYYWDGESLSAAICQYQSTGIADGSIVISMFSDDIFADLADYFLSIKGGTVTGATIFQSSVTVGSLMLDYGGIKNDGKNTVVYNDGGSLDLKAQDSDGAVNIVGGDVGLGGSVNITTDDINLNGNTNTKDVLPQKDDTYTVGSENLKYKNVYTNGLNINGQDATSGFVIEANSDDEVTAYLSSTACKSGQLIRVYDETEGVYNLYVIQTVVDEESGESSFVISPVNSDVSAEDVPYEINSDFTVQTANSAVTGITTVQEAIDALYKILSSLGASLDFNDTSSELSLYNYFGETLGDTIAISTSAGISGLKLEVDLNDETGVYTLLVYDSDDNLLGSTELPATGGSGGSSSNIVRLINQGSSGTTYTVVYGQTATLQFSYYEADSGGIVENATGTLEISYSTDGSTYTTIKTDNIEGSSSSTDTDHIYEFDITDYLISGSLVYFKVSVTDSTGDVTKSLSYKITAKAISISSDTTFDTVYTTSTMTFYYKCIGSGLSKIVYFYIDGEEYATADIGTSSNQTKSLTINLSELGNGSHDFRVWFETEGVSSNVLHYSIMYWDGSSEDPIIAAVADSEEITYGETVSVSYCVYTPNQETTDALKIELYSLDENGDEIAWASSNLTDVTNEVSHTWTCESYPTSGTAYIKLTSGETEVILEITIIENTAIADISTITEGLVFSFNTTGKSNNDSDKETIAYEYTDANAYTTTIDCTLENFNWVSDGYVTDSSDEDYGGDGGATVLRLASDAKFTLNLPILASSYEDSNENTVVFNGSTTGNGRTIEITLNMHHVTDNNAVVVSCIGDNGAGFTITPQVISLLTSSDSVSTDETGFILNETNLCVAYAKDAKKLRVSLVIEAINTDSTASDYHKQCLNIYINGEIAKSVPYDYAVGIAQDSVISFGNSACMTDIYDIKIYDRELEESEIRQNYYASQSTISARQAIYDDNDVLDDAGDISYDKAILKYPCLLCYGTLSAYKGDKTKVGWVLTKPDGNGGYTEEFGDDKKCAEKVQTKQSDSTSMGYVGQSNVQGTSSVKFIRKNYKVYPVYPVKDDDGNCTYDESGDIITKKFKYDIKDGGGGVAVSTLCWKADYMSTDHANTFNANLAEEIATTVAPSEVQTADSSIQNYVNGFRCLLFNTTDDGNTISFAGDGCLNNDKSNSSAFGYENDGDLEDEEGNATNVTKVQRFEFLNNTSDLCFFKTDNFRHTTTTSSTVNGVTTTTITEDVYNAFESTYPDQGDLEDEKLEPNWDYLQTVCSWVYQRANFWDASTETGTTYVYNDTEYYTERDYRKAIFQAEFEKHFNLKRTCIYYLFMEFVALVDNLAKNMFLTSFDVTEEQLLSSTDGETAISINDCINWENGDDGEVDGSVDISKIDWINSSFAIWEPTLYDLDSCYSADNNGYLQIPYYAEWSYQDSDGVNKFNGYGSRLWLCFEEAFASDIKDMACQLAKAELMTYEKFYKAHITDNADVVCASVVNKDMDYKYSEPWLVGYYDYSTSTTNPGWLQTSDYKYLHRGQRKEQKQAYIYNRSHMWYSKYQTTQFENTTINFRVGKTGGTTTDETNATLAASICLYLGAQFGDNTTIITNGKINPNTETTLQGVGGVGYSDTVRFYMGSDLTDIGDISVFRPYEIQLGNGKKLKKLIIGNEDIVNSALQSLDPSSCSLLQVINVAGCTSVTTLSLEKNGLIQEVYAQNSGIKTLYLPEGGNLTKIHYPEATQYIIIVNHTKLEEFECDGYDNLTRLYVENTPYVPTDEILLQCLSQLTEGVRLVGVEWDLSDESSSADYLGKPQVLELIASETAYGKYLSSSMTLNTKAYPTISGTVTVTYINQGLYETLQSLYPNLTINYTTFTHTVKFYDGDGNVVLSQEVVHGRSAVPPTVDVTKSATVEEYYTFEGWSSIYSNVVTDMDITAYWSSTAQVYDVEFYTDSTYSTLLYSVDSITYGESISYEGDNPSSSSDSIYVGWTANGETVFNFNLVTLSEDCCEIDEDGTPLKVKFYPLYDEVEMPSEASVTNITVSNLAESNSYGQIKAISDFIKTYNDNGGSLTGTDYSDWSVTYESSEYSYQIQKTIDSGNIYIVCKVGDTVEIPLSNGTTEIWEIADFYHDVDANGNYIGITFVMRDLYTGTTIDSSGYGYIRQMNPSYKQCYNYTIGETTYENDNNGYSSTTDTTNSVVYTPTSTELSQKYVELTINDRTFLRSIVVTDSGGTATNWYFDYNGYYAGGSSGVSSVSGLSWYLSDFTANSYKIGRLFYDVNGSTADAATLTSGTHTSSNFGGMTIIIGDSGKITHYYYVSADNYQHAEYNEITGDVVIRIPVDSSTATVTINPWTDSRNAGGYIRTTYREWVNDTFTEMLPLGWRNIATAAAKKTGIGNRNTSTVTTTDIAWALSGQEVGTITATNTSYDEGTVYPIYSDNASRIKYYEQGEGTVYSWYLRSPYVGATSGSSTFLNVNTSGTYSGSGNASNSYAVVLGLCV